MRPKHNLLGEQNRGWREGGWRLKALVEKKTRMCVWWPYAVVIGIAYVFMGSF